MASFRQPGMIITDRSFTVPLDHAQPGGATIELFAREVVAPDHAGGQPALAAVPAGRPRLRRAAAGRRRGLAGAGPEGLPGAAARPARHGPLLAGQPAHAGRAHPAAAGRLPGAVPGRLDRGRRRADPPPGHRRRAVVGAGAELRRVLHDHLPVVRAAGAARGPAHRRAARPEHARRRRVPADLSEGGRAEPGALRALPAGRGPGPADRRGAGRLRRPGCPAARG